MKVKRIIYCLIFFIMIFFMFSISSYGFSAGQEVVTKTKSYKYEKTMSGGKEDYIRDPSLSSNVLSKDEYSGKAIQIFVYIDKNVALKYNKSVNKNKKICEVIVPKGTIKYYCDEDKKIYKKETLGKSETWLIKEVNLQNKEEAKSNYKADTYIKNNSDPDVFAKKNAVALESTWATRSRNIRQR